MNNLDTATILAALSLGYLGISILIELLHILFLFTPSKRDDLWIENVKAKWLLVSKYIKWMSIKTPVSAVLTKSLTMLKCIREDVTKIKEKRK
jgi:hypothetical protein